MMSEQDSIDNLIALEPELLASHIDAAKGRDIVTYACKYFDSMPAEIQEEIEPIAKLLVERGYSL